MQLSTRGRYAVMALLDLALLQTEQSKEVNAIKLEEIANRQGISLSYLEQLFAQLRRAGLVGSVRGPGGGYKLAKEENEIFIIDIIDAVNEGVKATRCDGITGCLKTGRCNSHDLWSAFTNHIDDFMSQVHLKMVREKNITLGGNKVHVRIS